MVTLSRKKAKRPTDGTMSLMEHLYELRRRLFFAVLGLFLGGILGFIWFSIGIPALGIKPLGDLLIAPYCGVPSPPRVPLLGAADPHSCQLLATTPFSILQLRLKAALMAGAVVSSPVWLYQLWAFVTPALYNKERKFAVIFVSCAAALFAGGAVLAYTVIPVGLKVLLGFGGDTTAAALSPDSYYSFLIALLLVFGVSFELPLLLIMLNFIGVLTGRKLAKWRRYSIFGIFVFAAIVVPGNDPITMTALAAALAILYEVAVQVSKFHDKRKGRVTEEEGLADLSDDEASPMPAAPTGLGSSGGVGGTSPVAPPTPVTDPQRFDPRDLGDAT